MSNDHGGPAFPASITLTQGNRLVAAPEALRGMTLRDYFAAKAMQGFVAHPESDYAPLIDEEVPMLAREAYRLADAMLTERAK